MSQTPVKQVSTGHVALVTGAARGIGEAIAERLAMDGHRVVLVDRLETTEEIAARLRSRGLDVVAVSFDLGDLQAVEGFFSELSRREGIDIVVNNAGISPKHDGKSAPAAETALPEWQQVLDINLTAPFLISKATLPVMRAKGWGRFINMSSQAARTGSRVAGAHYAASKAGLIAFSRSLAIQVGGEGITVNCIAPGRIDTPMAREAGAAVNTAYVATIPAGRIGTPEEVADAVSFYAGEGAGFVTGTVMDVNGGHYMG
ncbi:MULTISPECIES: SDR family oxidoreductase [unclassified Haematobacter]|uniref:SDR family oxidoreductase n=1 Tax=unclassified Haematobacter TaxID=2640585 RepID=UPI0025BE4DDC|nr:MULTISPECIES: SDR family NAD(P)-dependent oxidoreductase [unclassified Haematobacter]